MLFFEGQNYLDDQETLDSQEMDHSSEGTQFPNQVSDNEEQAYIQKLQLRIQIERQESQKKDFIIQNLRQNDQRRERLIKEKNQKIFNQISKISDQAAQIESLKNERKYLYLAIQDLKKKSIERESSLNKRQKALKEMIDPKETLVQMIKTKQQSKTR